MLRKKPILVIFSRPIGRPVAHHHDEDAENSEVMDPRCSSCWSHARSRCMSGAMLSVVWANSQKAHAHDDAEQQAVVAPGIGAFRWMRKHIHFPLLVLVYRISLGFFTTFL